MMTSMQRHNFGALPLRNSEQRTVNHFFVVFNTDAIHCEMHPVYGDVFRDRHFRVGAIDLLVAETALLRNVLPSAHCCNDRHHDCKN